MYKIYINETPLILKSASEMSALTGGNERTLVARYPGRPKFLFNYVDMLEKSKRFESVTLYADSLEQLYADFVAQYKRIEAAGGVVFNPRREVLLIYRRGYWDLPKGKLDPGETIEAAALREVQEETGLRELSLLSPLGQMYHTYREDKQRVLKRTHWFVMETTQEELTPQAEENIEQAVWWDVQGFFGAKRQVYNSIREVLQNAVAKF